MKEIISIEFSGEDFELIRQYMEEANATSAQTAILNAVSIALDRLDNVDERLISKPTDVHKDIFGYAQYYCPTCYCPTCGREFKGLITAFCSCCGQEVKWDERNSMHRLWRAVAL